MSGAQQKTPPDPSDIEISIFGPGFGESILVHVGDSRWIVVDSCIDRQAKKPASLVYFEEIGCNPEKCVDRIVATHWHDDHIAGIDSVLQRFPNAQFWVSDALQSIEFLKLIDPEFTRHDLKFTRGANTIARVVERIGRDFRWAVAATRIFQGTVTGAKVPVEVWALSPSHH